MTYNQVIKRITELLQSHAMIKTVKTDPPAEWLMKETQPEYPLACFWIDNGTFNPGREQSYIINFFFLDKSDIENRIADDVISDMISVAYDIVEKMRLGSNGYFIDDAVNFQTISDKYEDYLGGCSMVINLTAQSEFNACNFVNV